MSQMNFEKKFGQSAIFVTSTLMEQGGVPPSSSPAALLKEAIHVISCGYEDKTEWGLEVKFRKSHAANISNSFLHFRVSWTVQCDWFGSDWQQ